MLKYIIIGVICCLALETNATTVLLSDYKAPKNEEFKAFNELYVTGVMEGLLTFNAKLATDGKPKLFCLPPKKEVTTQQAAEIMMHQAKDVPDADNYPISILLLAGLTDTFRCEEQTRRVVRPGVEPAEQQPGQAIHRHRKHRGDTSKQPTGHPRKARP
jgi:Rap1a immunity proteins